MTSNQIKAWRERRAVSQAQLADLLGVDSMTISRWERGIQTPPAFLALAMEALDHRLKGKGRK